MHFRGGARLQINIDRGWRRYDRSPQRRAVDGRRRSRFAPCPRAWTTTCRLVFV